MGIDIKEILRRRSDLSTFLVHFTRNKDGISARSRLESILTKHKIEALTPMGHAKKALDKAAIKADSQRVVCFTETPLEYAHLLLEEISGRGCHFEPYGIAIPKKVGRDKGVNPVWYVDINPTHDWPSRYINQLVDEAILAPPFEAHPIAYLAPLIEQMGTSTEHGYRKEFWWEREWRQIGDFELPPRVIVLVPEEEISSFKDVLSKAEYRLAAAFVDPRWSLEQIIAHLAGFAVGDIDVI